MNTRILFLLMFVSGFCLCTAQEQHKSNDCKEKLSYDSGRRWRGCSNSQYIITDEEEMYEVIDKYVDSMIAINKYTVDSTLAMDNIRILIQLKLDTLGEIHGANLCRIDGIIMSDAEKANFCRWIEDVFNVKYFTKEIPLFDLEYYRYHFWDIPYCRYR